MRPSHIGILGLGLIGSSAARGLVRRREASGYRVSGYDPSPDTRWAAAAAGIDVAADPADLDGCDVLLLAAPTAANSELLKAERSGGYRRAVADLGSVKEPIERVWLAGRPRVSFVGTHPMAGSEAAGFAAGSSELFADAAWPVVVHEDTDPEALLLVLGIITELGARPVPVSARTHDEVIALVSHVPHLMAGVLGHAAAASPHANLAVRLAGGSYRDGSRVSASPPQRSAEFLVANGHNAAHLARVAARSLDHVANILDQADEEAVAEWLRPAHSLREAFGRRWALSQPAVFDGSAARIHQHLLGLRDSGSWVVSISGGSPDTWQVQLAVATGQPHG